MLARDQRIWLEAGCPPVAGILLAVGVVLAALLIQMAPGLAEVLQWKRSMGGGLTWLTAHLCHWSWNHLAWDLIVFAVMSILALRLMPARYTSCLLVSAVLISLEIQFNQRSLDSYRGLSGIDCALFGLVVAALWRSSSGDGQPCGGKWLAVIASGCFVVKATYEGLTGNTVFVESGQGGQRFVPVVSAHVMGFVSGLVLGAWKEVLLTGTRARADLVCATDQ